MKVLAIDIGGTAIKYGEFQNHLLTVSGQFPVRGADGIEALPEKLCALVSAHPADRIAVAVPGPFDYTTGTSHMTQKLPSLYHICLKDRLRDVLPETDVAFVHDLTAFAVGVLSVDHEPVNDTFACVTLGTGLGYTRVEGGKVLLNAQQRPVKSLWHMELLDGIAEDYVSARRFLQCASELGYHFQNVLELSLEARRNNSELLSIFDRTGECLAMAVNKMRSMQEIEHIVIGGQISKSFDLMKEGFERLCDIPYCVVNTPEIYSLYGLMALSEAGKERYCRVIE